MLFSSCCNGSLLAVKVRSVDDGGYPTTSTGGGTNTSYSGIAEFWVLVFSAFDDASASNSVDNIANTVGVMVSNEGRGAVFVVMHVGHVNITILGTVWFSTCAVSRGFVVVLEVIVATTAAASSVVASKRLV